MPEIVYTCHILSIMPNKKFLQMYTNNELARMSISKAQKLDVYLKLRWCLVHNQHKNFYCVRSGRIVCLPKDEW